MLKKLRKLVAGIVLASLSVGLFPIQVSATSYTVVQNIASSLIKTSNSSNRVDVSDNAALKPAQITVAAWIKMQSPANPSFQPFVIKSSSGSWNDGYAIATDSSGGLRFWVNAWNAGAAVTPATPYTGRWIRVVGTYDLQNVKLYVNGSLVNTSASYTTAITHSTGNLRFLNDLSTDYALGNISDVSISGAAWSATDVANDYYNANLPSSVTNRWKCDEGAGTNAVDSVGGLDGTITGLTYSPDAPSKARLAVRDIKASLNFSASSDKVDAGTDFIGTGNVTVCGWIKPTAAGGGGAGRIFDNGSTSLAITTSSGVPRLQASNDGGTTTKLSAAASLTFNSWQFICYTRSSAKLVNFRINGAASGTADQDAGTIGAASTNTIIGNKSAGSFQLISKLSRLRVFNRILTIAEQDALYYGIDQLPSDYKTSMVAEYLSSEGAGTTLNDTSGNGHNGTITGATFVSDTPSKPYSLVNPNLVKNGNFEYAPPFVAAATTANRWFDGTAAGSVTNDLFRWSFRSQSGTTSAQFDSTEKHGGTSSLKISTLAVSSYVEVASYRGSGTPTASDAQTYLVKVSPSTSYSFSYWMKTNVTSGDSSNGAAVAFQEVGPSGGSIITSTLGTYVKTTTGWTQYTGTFTTNSGTAYINVNPRVYGHTGAATLIMDAWFDDIVLTPTTAYQTQNLLQYTQSFDNAYWTKTRASIPASYVTDPFGGTNAQILHEDNTAGATHVVYKATPGFTGLMTASLYVKASNRSWIALAPNGGSVARYFNVSTGTIGSGGGDLSYGMQYAGNGWYRCWVTYISDGSHLYYYIASASGTVSFNGLDQDSLYIYGAQVERGAQMTPYLRIDATPYNPNGGSIIARQQNLIAYSDPSVIGNFSSSGGSTSVASFAWPANTTPGLAYAASYGNNAVIRYTYFSNTFVKGQTYTLSFYVSMDDGSVPVVTTNSAGCDLLPVIETTAIDNINNTVTVTPIGSGVSKVTATYKATGSGGFYVGVIKYTTMSAKTFKASGFQLTQANWSPPLKATTGTPFNEGNIYNLAY